jgi:hypothetical protein
MTTKASALDAERQSQHLAMLEGRLSELQAENQSLREQSDAAADNTHMEGNAAGPTSGGSALGLIHTGTCGQKTNAHPYIENASPLVPLDWKR